MFFYQTWNQIHNSKKKKKMNNVYAIQMQRKKLNTRGY